MRLLALDTATSAITVAVHDGEQVLATRTTVDARRHTELFAPMIVDALAAAGTDVTEVTHVAVGTGPGPFTGLRVGLVTAQTFAHARGITVHGVCSLDALAAAAAAHGHEGELLVATDARRKEVYWARYDCTAGEVVLQEGPAVTKPADLPEPVRALPTIGRGPVVYPELLPAALTLPGVDLLDVDAGALAALAATRIAAGADMPVEPLYLRRPDAVAPAAAGGAGAAGGDPVTTATVTPLRLREARWQDLAVLADHERELFGAEAWSLASWWGELAGRPRREYVVAEDADGIAGYGGLDHAGDTSDVMTIATLPRARGTGLGRRLLAELVDRARAAGAERLVLEVRADNVAARGLYDSAGFGLLQSRRGYYPGGVDALVLALDLTQETQA
ncbi:peptidase M22 glycoprotease [Janibacter hoylei PVAS-1]|uniref:Peptidase M22 glycoprotease n=1 Tax=Janibacter hoylei PVAS-1 TaxID=1210046 RepID=K1E5Y0_9MICO|nr:peptidase M22 glycoprotease [Janibacter hoylei PVAS-1]